MSKIVFLQPGYAHYRKKLFTLLAKRHNLTYIYISSKNVYPGEVDPGELPHHFLDKQLFPVSMGIFWSLFRRRPDIIITSISSSLQTIIAYIYATLFRKKIILWIEEWRKPDTNGVNLRNLLRAIRFLVGKRIILASDVLIVSGIASHKYALSIGKADKDILVTTQCSEDISQHKNQVITRMKGRTTYLYMSRIIDWKGLDLLLKAYSKLETEKDNVFLLIAGDGPFRNYCEELASSLKIKHVEFIGNVDPAQVGDIYNKADVFVLPSCFRGNSYEHWGLVINEAMSMSLPIITTSAVGASYDMVENYKNGIVIKAGMVSELYDAMNNILDYDLKKMGDLSRSLFEQKNDYAEMASVFTEAIRCVDKL